VPTSFDRHTHVTPDGPGRFRVMLDPSWWIVRGPNGGYIAALLVRALEAAVADPARQLRSLTVHFLRPPEEGPAEIEVSVDRQGRTLTNLRATLVQKGRLQATALAAFAAARDTPSLHHAVMPEVRPPEALTPRAHRAIPIHQHYELRFALGPASQDEPRIREAVSGGWIRLREGRALDAALLTAYSDGWPPAVFATGELPPSMGGVPTIDLTVHIRATLPAGVGPEDPVLVVFRTRELEDGYLEEDGELWSRGGQLLAQVRQLAVHM
jgi:acyl-CoA thioesterase